MNCELLPPVAATQSLRGLVSGVLTPNEHVPRWYPELYLGAPWQGIEQHGVRFARVRNLCKASTSGGCTTVAAFRATVRGRP
jgi:hypothetical protein